MTVEGRYSTHIPHIITDLCNIYIVQNNVFLSKIVPSQFHMKFSLETEKCTSYSSLICEHGSYQESMRMHIGAQTG